MRRRALLVSLLLWINVVKGIHIDELQVPAHAAAGGEALLGCTFDMEGDLLYSVKWYKDGKEFYRYMPRSQHQALRFNRPGVTVDMSRSSSDVVTLTHIRPESAGLYRCEVSGEKPLFATAAKEKYITVHILPKTGPKVTGLRYQYEIGDRVIANCSVPGSRPEARVKWMVNGRPVPRSYLRGPWRKEIDDIPDMMDITQGINFMVLPSHYKTGVLELKCQATIAPLYQREKVYVLSKPEVTDEPLPNPEPPIQAAPHSITDDEIHEDLVSSFRELVNTVRLDVPDKGLAHPYSFQDSNSDITTTETPTATDIPSSAYQNETGKSFDVFLFTMSLLLQVILIFMNTSH